MSKILARLALTASAALALTACGSDSASSPEASATPDAAVRTSVELARKSDVAGLLEHVLPPADFARVKAEWSDSTQKTEPSAEDRARFEQMMGELTAPDAEEKLYAQVEPQLAQFDAQYKAQLPGMVAMGQGYLQGMVQQNTQLSATEKEQANAAIKALGDWVQKTNFTDPDRVKKAIGIAAATARKLELKTLDEARALTFDQAMPKVTIALEGLKDILAVFDFSINDTLDSVKAEVATTAGDAATVKIGYTLLGTPLATQSEMVRIDNRWYAKDTVEKLREHAAETAAPAAAPQS